VEDEEYEAAFAYDAWSTLRYVLFGRIQLQEMHSEGMGMGFAMALWDAMGDFSPDMAELYLQAILRMQSGEPAAWD